ncbi:MAG TPA: proteasome assembly chaperone family protein, partial [Archaeoglobus profundus]|nr:proteasome assembly chaperone family protein [Archaeoglobus profundus]
GLALLGETLGFNPDPRAAAEVINVLNRMFNWDINVEKLIKEAEIIEAQMQRLAEQTKLHEEKAFKREELPMYG